MVGRERRVLGLHNAGSAGQVMKLILLAVTRCCFSGWGCQVGHAGVSDCGSPRQGSGRRVVQVASFGLKLAYHEAASRLEQAAARSKRNPSPLSGAWT